MPDITRIPFTEIFERVKNELVRDATANTVTEDKYKGRVNDVYMFTVPGEIDYRHIRKTGSITTLADYTTGTIALTNASTTCTGTSTVWTSANSNNFLLKANSYNEVYRVTYSSATVLTLDRVWVEATDTSESYRIYQDRYALASDFSRMIKDPDRCVYYWDQGVKTYLTYKNPEEFQVLQSSVPGTPYHYTVDWVADDPYIFIDPPDTSTMTVHYEYIPSLARMTEYTTGTITTLANAGTAVTGSGTDFDGYVADTTNYTYYLRIDSDGTGSSSKWYKITSAGSDTAIVLADAYEGTAISGGSSAYTISKVSLLPAGLDTAIMYGAALISSIDQDSKTQPTGWSAMYNDSMSKYKAVENTRDYGKSRIHTIYERPGVRR